MPKLLERKKGQVKFLVISILFLVIISASIVTIHFIINNYKLTKMDSREDTIKVQTNSLSLYCPSSPDFFSKKEFSFSDKDYDPVSHPVTNNLYSSNALLSLGYISDLDNISKGDLGENELKTFSSTLTKPSIFSAEFEQTSLVDITNGISVSDAKSGDLKGGSALECINPKFEFFWTGVNSLTQHSIQLNIYNPSPNTANIEIELYDKNGQIQLENLPEGAVAPQTSKKILLNQLANNKNELSIKLISKGAQIFSTIQYSELQGITPKGVDFVENLDLTKTSVFNMKNANKFSENKLSVFSKSGGVINIDYNNNHQTMTLIPSSTQTLDLESKNLDSLVTLTSNSEFVANIKQTKDDDFLFNSPLSFSKEALLQIPKNVNNDIYITNNEGNENVLIVSRFKLDGSKIDDKTITLPQNNTIILPRDILKDPNFLLITNERKSKFSVYSYFETKYGISSVSFRHSIQNDQIYKINEL